MVHVSAIAHEAVRAQFPALKSGFGFFENAGGSQIPQVVIQAIQDYLVSSCVQTGSTYEHSVRCSQVVADAHRFYNTLFNGEGFGETAVGPSTTALTHMLAGSIARSLKPGDEIVISVANHESNAWPWALLERQGAVIKWWGVNADSGASSLDELAALLTPRTRVVAFPVTSNLLGDTMPVRNIADLAHGVGARVVVDAVAYASHAALDVRAWDADFCVFSNYKVYGPHIAGMWGRREAWLELEGPNHYFIPNEEIPRKFELGCLSYEALAGVLALGSYLQFLAGSSRFDRTAVTSAFDQMKAMETPVTRILLNWLQNRDDVRIVGPTEIGPQRHPTISFLPLRKSSDLVSRFVNERGFGIRHGHMYSLRLCEAMGIPGDPGVVRVSAVHYNTPEEAHRLTALLGEVLD